MHIQIPEINRRSAYPEQFSGIEPIEIQINALEKAFGVSGERARNYVSRTSFQTHPRADGLFCWPSVNALAKRYFPDVRDPKSRYCHATRLVLDTLRLRREFFTQHFTLYQIDPELFQPSEHTLHALQELERVQHGDIIVAQAQLGSAYAEAVKSRSEMDFVHKIQSDDLEFGLHVIAGASILMTHPDRLSKNNYFDLGMECIGDQLSTPGDPRVQHVQFRNHDGTVETLLCSAILEGHGIDQPVAPITGFLQPRN